MAFNPEYFYYCNVTDTCSVWNILSSTTLFKAVVRTDVLLLCTSSVIYECLYKPRKTLRNTDEELRNRLVKARGNGYFKKYDIDIEDLQVPEILEARKRLGIGELSSIALAVKYDQAVLTDDKTAEKSANAIMKGINRGQGAQTTPHLVAWLVFHGQLSDSDIELILKEHEKFGRNLSGRIEDALGEARRCKNIAGRESCTLPEPQRRKDGA